MSDTNQAVQPQKIARGLKFRIQEVEGLYYPFSENEGADQLRSYCAADLRLCFRICKSRFSHNEAHITSNFPRLSHSLSLFLSNSANYPRYIIIEHKVGLKCDGGVYDADVDRLKPL